MRTGLFGQVPGPLAGHLWFPRRAEFHETKNITCGEGGALLINDPRLIERAEIIVEKGTNRSRFFGDRWINIPGWTLVRAM